MLLETLLILVAVVAGAVVIAVAVVPAGRPARWIPTWDNLSRLCSECEHELRYHTDGPRGRNGVCRAAGDCGCRVSRRRAFPTSLTEHELQARKELRGL